MPTDHNNTLAIYTLNVGQADTTILITPERRVIIIDAVRPNKIIKLLSDLGFAKHAPIEKVIITHPHHDHFSGANRLIKHFKVRSLTLSPFWNELGMGPPTYRKLINHAENEISIDFVSGYSRFYPDGSIRPIGEDFKFDNEALYIEFLGPPNSLISQLERDRKLDTNHLSIITRINWKNFSMVLAADAQMENWSFFDREGMLNKKCNVFKTAHHGSCHGTQWERIKKLNPKYTIISSDPEGKNHLPDMIGVSIFSKYFIDYSPSKVVSITKDTGSIRFIIEDGRLRSQIGFGEEKDQNLDLDQYYNLSWANSKTNWKDLLSKRVNESYN